MTIEELTAYCREWSRRDPLPYRRFAYSYIAQHLDGHKKNKQHLAAELDRWIKVHQRSAEYDRRYEQGRFQALYEQQIAVYQELLAETMSTVSLLGKATLPDDREEKDF